MAYLVLVMQNASTLRSDSNRASSVARLVVLIALIIIPATARANESVVVASDVFIEKLEHRADGSRLVRLEPATGIRSGDSLVFRLNYSPEAATGSRKMLTSAVPASVSFIGGGDIVSVDGGRIWGRLGDLSVRGNDGRMRRALAEDVTHVRWMVGNRDNTRAGLLFRGRAR